jgi:hypothetical protein
MGTALDAVPGLAKAADTGQGGYALVNGTGAILAWTAPADGQQHRVTAVLIQHVTLAETGGAIQVTYTLPDGTASSATPFAGGSAAGVASNVVDRLVQAGTTVTLSQSSALTAGAAGVWAQIWAG